MRSDFVAYGTRAEELERIGCCEPCRRKKVLAEKALRRSLSLFGFAQEVEQTHHGFV